MSESDETPAEQYARWRKIKEEQYGKRYEMYLTNELPRFGSGHRSYYVKEGRKWAKFTKHIGDPADTTGRMRGRLPLAKWNTMKEKHEQYLQRNDPDETAKRNYKRRI